MGPWNNPRKKRWRSVKWQCVWSTDDYRATSNSPNGLTYILNRKSYL